MVSFFQCRGRCLFQTAEKYATGEKDFSSLITKMRSIDPDCLVVMDQGDAVAAIFNQADAAGWDIQHVSLGPGTSEQLINQLTNDIVNTHSSQFL